MDGIVDKGRFRSGEKSIFPRRCSQCGGVIHSGRELAVNDQQILCEGCYRLMVNPDTSGDIPSKWF